MTEPIDPSLMEQEAERMEPVLRRLLELRRDAMDPDLSPEELAIQASIEAASRSPQQERMS